MDHRQSYRDQDVQNRQSASHEASAGPLPAQGEPSTVFFFLVHVNLDLTTRKSECRNRNQSDDDTENNICVCV